MRTGRQNEQHENNPYTLKYLFHRLLCGTKTEAPVVMGYGKLRRPELLQMFFSEPLYASYGDQLSQITWFLNGDERNKSIRSSLIGLLRQDCQSVLRDMQQRCREILWPGGQHPAFDRQRLYRLLCSVRFNFRGKRKWRIIPETSTDMEEDYYLPIFFGVDVASALARTILTLAIAFDAEDNLILQIWSAEIDIEPAHDDMTVEEMYQRGRILYLDGRREQAFGIFEQAAAKLACPAQTVQESMLYCQLASMLLVGEGHYQDRTSALHYLQLAKLAAYPQSFYLLAHSMAPTEAFALLTQAAELGHAKAITEVGNAYFYGNREYGCAEDKSQALTWFMRNIDAENVEHTYSAFMAAQCYEARGDVQRAAQFYQVAQAQGHPESYKRLASMKLLSSHPDAGAIQAPRSGETLVCFMNAQTGYNRSFRKSLPAHCRIHVAENVAEEIASQTDALLLRADAPKEILVVVLSADQEDNLQQTISLLSVLYQMVLDHPEREQEIVQRVRIFVMAQQQHAERVLDASFSGISGYFRVRVCDPCSDAVDELYRTRPIFLPCLQEATLSTVRMLVIGGTRMAMEAVKRAIALPLPAAYQVELHVLCEDAEAAKQAFMADCPGVMTAPLSVRRITPYFHQCATTVGGIHAMLRNAWHDAMQNSNLPDEDTGRVLLNSNYYIVVTDDDKQNMDIAIMLRRTLLKADPTFTKLPFIAAATKDATLGGLVGNITVNSDELVRSAQDQYGLFSFGVAELYTWQGLLQDVLEERAQRIHLHYCGSPEKHEQQYEAMADYYRRQYNRSSSRAMALGLSYRMFACGFALSNPMFYSVAEKEIALAREFVQWLSVEKNLITAAAVEHERWNCFLLSVGWETASLYQVEAYVKQGVRGHQHHLARLHPFIRSWQELVSGDLLRQVNSAVQRVYPDRMVADPCVSDRDAVLITEEIIDGCSSML